jgi:hypothetical protein
VRPGDLAPDDTDLGAADLSLATVDVGNALAVVEGGGLGVVNALDLDERGVGPDRVLRALERDVLAPVGRPVSLCVLSFFRPCHARVRRGAMSCRIAVGYPPFVIRSSSSDGYFGADVLDVKSVTLLGRHLDGCSGDLKGELFGRSLGAGSSASSFTQSLRVACGALAFCESVRQGGPVRLARIGRQLKL